MSLPGLDPNFLREARATLESMVEFFDTQQCEPEAFQEYRRLILIVHGGKFFFQLFGASEISVHVCNDFRETVGVQPLDRYETNIVRKHNLACQNYLEEKDGTRRSIA